MATSTKQLQQFLLWARKEKIVISSVTLQGVTVTVDRDYNLVPPKGIDLPSEPKRSMYEQFGAALFQQQAPAGGGETANEPTVEDEDD